MKRPRMMGLVTGLALAAGLCSAQGSAEELSGTLKKIKETGVITIGYRDSSIPFSYLDDNQKPIGFAIDICLKIVEAVKNELKLDKLTVEFNPVTSSTRIPLLANGTIDLECGSTTNNPDRLKQVAFTNTHFLTATRFISKKSSKLELDRGPQGQDGRLHVRHDQYQAAHRSQCCAQSWHQHRSRQGTRRIVSDGGNRSRSRGGAGRYSAGELRCRIKGSKRVCHLRGRLFQTGALRHHAAQGRPGLQESG